MSEGDITFVNVVVDLIRCYCHDNDVDTQIIFDSIAMTFKKEAENVDRDKT